MTTEPFHPLANLFPFLEQDDLNSLAADIKENGQHDPIIMLDGLVLDGRNRWRACNLAGVKPRTIVYTGPDPLKFVVSVNLRRRHLNESQRGMLAARIANMPFGGDGRNQHTKEGSPNLGTPPESPKISVAEASKLANVGRGTTENAKVVLNKGTPEQIAAIDAGTAKASSTAKKINKDAQQRAADAARAAKPTAPAPAAAAPSMPPQEAPPEKEPLMPKLPPLPVWLTRERLDQIIAIFAKDKAREFDERAIPAMHAMLDALKEGKPFGAKEFEALAGGVHERICTTYVKFIHIMSATLSTVPEVPDEPPAAWLSLPKQDQYEKALAAAQAKLEKEFDARVQYAAAAKVAPAVENMRAQLEVAVKERNALKGKIPASIYKTIMMGAHEDRFDSPERKAAANEAFKYLREFQSVLSMTPEEEAQKIASLKRKQEFDRQWAANAAKVREQEMEKARKAAARKAAKAANGGASA